MSENSLFVPVPAVTLPNGVTVPSFLVGQFLCAKGEDGAAVMSATAAPWLRINYAEAKAACAAVGGALIRELQYLAIAFDISQQDINWTGGKVGEGQVFQGLHEDTVGEPQPGDFESDNENERRWHQLSNGERVYDFAGNAYSWVFDDVQGDEHGIVAARFAKDSPSIATAPYPSMEKGMGWRPEAGRNWSGRALLRGGCWDDGGGAGVFRLDLVSPDGRNDVVGFRCTKPSSGL
jgi:formylglycine-generating enzyme required for sulfatase activity